jgi:hypothetical protein
MQPPNNQSTVQYNVAAVPGTGTTAGGSSGGGGTWPATLLGMLAGLTLRASRRRQRAAAAK